jgi:serine/threonine protein phosphatase PrpC
MSINFSAQTNIGQKRQVNEDSMWPTTGQHDHLPTDPYGMLFMVADGMGGHGAGDIASGLAVAHISAQYYGRGAEITDIAERLELAILSAHQAINERAAQAEETQNMGTTVVAVVVKFDESSYRGEAWVAWVGDSRVYLSRGGRLQQVSRDHSRVWPFVEAGLLTWDQVHFHPDRSKITNALTPGSPHAEPEIKRIELEPGDKLLLCSDGLSGEVRPEELEQILAAFPPAEAAVRLIEKANAPKDLYADGQTHHVEGGNDNITVIIVQMPVDQTQTQPLSIGGAGPTTVMTPTSAQTVTAVMQPAPPVRKGKKMVWLGGAMVIAGLLLLLALAGGGGYLLFLRDRQPAEVPAAVATAVPAPLPAANTPTPPNPVIIAVEAGATLPLTPTEIAAPQTEIAPAPAETRPPTVTRGPTSLPTDPPTATLPPSPTPIPTATPLITATVALTPEAIAWPTPVLLAPAADETGRNPFDVSQEIPFVWQWPGELPADYSFEIQVWQQGAEPTGAHDAGLLRQDSSFQHFADDSYTVALALAGAEGVTETGADYFWTVGLVRTRPAYEWLGVAAPPRRFSLVVPEKVN